MCFIPFFFANVANLAETNCGPLSEIRQPILCKHLAKGFEGVSCGCGSHFHHFCPFRVNIYDYEKHASLERPCKVHVNSGPRGVWPQPWM